MKIKKLIKSAVSLAMVFALFAVPCLSSFAAEENTVYIKTEKDLSMMAKNCRLDIYSSGKTFVLLEDISLDKSEFKQIPVFRGTFDGNGHTLSGFFLRDSIAPAGFFGIVETDGVVKNLKLKGSVIPDGESNATGGIAGINRGLIEECEYEGSVSGKEEVGGIAGINEFSGIVKNCSSIGKVNGQKKTGGVVGANHGMVDNCHGECLINVDSKDPTIDINEIESDMQSSIIDKDLDVEKIYRSVEDAGGIAGFSDGIITNSTNKGDVGHNHIGYNMGGIVGRNQGFIYGSVNYGIINGRREVGGIIGQAEPFVASNPDTDNLGNIRNELHKLSNLVDKATRDVDDSSSRSSERLSNITELISKANDNVKDLSDTLTSYVDENLEEINRGSDVLKSVADRLDSITGKLPAINNRITDTMDELSDGMEELKKAGSKASDAMGDFSLATDDLKVAFSIVEDASAYISDGAKQISGAISYDPDTKKSNVKWDEIDAGVENLNKGIEVLDKGNEKSDNKGVYSYLESASGHLEDGAVKLEDAANNMNAAFDSFDEAFNILESVSRDITGVLEEVSSLADFLSNTSPLKFSYIKSRTEQTSSDLHNNFTNLSRELDSLNIETKSSSDILMEDIRAINNQFFVVMDLLVDEIEDFQNASLNGRIEDISEEDIKNSTDGKAQYCVNYGNVIGDINVGGIAGSMGIFNEQNPEDSNKTINETLRARYRLKAILMDCTNYGDVNSKKDYAGAICGISLLGIITDCKGYGNAISDDGDYVGGISGANSTTIINSYAKCGISGKKYVGGITGLNSTKDNGSGKITNCVSAISIISHEQYSGAICGQDEGEIENNLFFGDYAGINNASYVGKAEPVTFEELIAIENIPKEFKSFKVSFVANDEIVKELHLNYLDSYNMDKFPDVPKVEGQYGKWDKTQIYKIDFDEVVTAEYFPYVTAIESEPENLDEPAKFIAIGSFDDNSVLDVSTGELSDEKIKMISLPKELFTKLSPKEMWIVSAESLDPGNVFLRYYKGDIKEKTLGFYYKNNDSWEKADAKEVGGYMQIEVPNGTNSIVVAHRSEYALVVGILVALAFLTVVAFFIRRRRPRIDLE